MFCVLAVVPLLAACGARSGRESHHCGGAGDTSAPAIGGDATSGATEVITDLDVCGLLSSEDAAAVAQERGWSGSASATTTYTLTATKVDYEPHLASPDAG